MTAMFITPPEPNHTRSANADWMELRALRAAAQRSTLGDIFGIFDINDHDDATDHANDDLDDESILEAGRNRPIDHVFDELQYRARVLGGTYPFTVETTPPALAQARDITATPGRVIYLFCLLASAMRENRVQPSELTKGARKEIANLFQVCACLAAGGYTVGAVASFGFPRATGDNFLSALRDTYGRFGAGEVRSTVPPGHPTATKDDGIDVVGWRHHPDRMPGKLYLLGQCASGRKWQEKSVVDRIQQFHGWFSTPPATYYLPSIFIPFTLHHDLSEHPTTAFDAVLTNKYLREERRYGIVFDRFRIAHFAGACLGSKDDELSQVDGREQFRDVEAWVEATLEIPGFMESA